MMKLFAIYVGGEHPMANIEVHDVRFAVAESLAETFEQLRAEWWGKAGTLHVDCWAEVTHADGYAVALRREPSCAAEKLYFVNLGGYDGTFAELHKSLFVVSTSTVEAKRKALRSVKTWKDGHRDDLYEAEQAFALDVKIGSRLYIHLSPEPTADILEFNCRYTPVR